MPDDFLDDIEPAAAQEAGAGSQHLQAHGGKLEDLQQHLILASLQAHGGNISATARALGVSRNTVYRKINGAR